MQTTLSSGYYRDVSQRTHFPAFFYWTVTHSTARNIESNFDMGVSNSFVPNSWKFRFYQAFVSVPLYRNSNLPSFRQPQLWIGRQLLTEGFELASMDGVQVPFAFSQAVGVQAYGGALRNLEDENLAQDSKVAGLSAFGKAAQIRYRAGYLYKQNSTLNTSFAHGALQRSFELPWAPELFAKAQWELTRPRLDQAVSELQLHPSEVLTTSFEYSSRQPRSLDAGNTLFIYRLFAISTQEQLGARISWRISPDASMDTGVHRVGYRSKAGMETSFQEELGFTFRQERNTWTPSFIHLKSYGGSLYQAGLRYLRLVSSLTRFHAEGDVARVEKINGIQSWAYHGRSGVGFQLGSRFLAQILLEGERNHIFKIDARAVAYVSHFLY